MSLLLLFGGVGTAPPPPGTVVNRRPTENPGTVGTRSPDTQMPGL